MPDPNPRCSRRCECPSCTIGIGDFSGAASSTVSGFTEVLGDWALDGSGRVYPDTSPAILKFDTAHPDGVDGNQNLHVPVRATGTGVVRARGLVAYADDENYLAAEVYIDDAGCDFLKLYQVVGGVETQLGDSQTIIGAVFDEDYDLRVCWDPNNYGSGYEGYGTLRASLSGGGLEYTYGNQATAQASGAYVGLATAGGIPKFGNLHYKYMKDTDTHQACPDCNTPCPISGDPFDDADRTACLWNGGTVDTGLEEFTTTGDTRHNVFHPQLKNNEQVSVSVLGAAAGGPDVTVPIKIASDDAGNSFEVIYTTDVAHNKHRLTIYRNGVELDYDEETSVTFPAEATYRNITVCFDGHELSATSEGLCTLEAAMPIENGKWVSLGGSNIWKNFSLRKTNSEESPKDRCGVCGCVQPKACACCNESIDDAYIVDLGAGGWGDRLYQFFCWFNSTHNQYIEYPCDICSKVGGEYVVESQAYTPPPGFPAGCLWSYTSITECLRPASDLEDCTGYGPQIRHNQLGISLFFSKRVVEGVEETWCRWSVQVAINWERFGLTQYDSCVGGGEMYAGGAGNDPQVNYWSEQIDPDKCREFPVKLTKDPTSSSEDGCPCTGNLPDEIWIRKITP